MAPPDERKPFTISTHASGEATGAVLSQEGRPVVFISRRLKPAEKIKSAYERELIALVYIIVNGNVTKKERRHTWEQTMLC